jgi:hypothetical protein
VIVYAPHWQKHRSSWWKWGRDIVAWLAGQRDHNVILAPHQRLVETDPAIDQVLAPVTGLPHMLVDATSFATVDGSYTAAADIYLGDTSSRVLEYLIEPRPCVFLNADGIDWRSTDDHEFWRCGDVVDDLGGLAGAIASAPDRYGRYVDFQRSFVADSLGPTGPRAAANAAEAILAAVRAGR